MKRTLVVVITALMFMAGSAMAAVNFNTGVGYALYSDSRIEGMSTQFELSWQMDAIDIGYKIEEQSLTLSDAQAAVSNIQLKNRLSLMTIRKDIISDVGIDVKALLEFGPMVITPLAGTVAIAGSTLNQVVPVIGISGEVNYMNKGKVLDAGIVVRLGYRYVDINDSVDPAAFAPGGQNITDLHAVNAEVGLKVKF